MRGHSRSGPPPCHFQFMLSHETNKFNLYLSTPKKNPDPDRLLELAVIPSAKNKYTKSIKKNKRRGLFVFNPT